MIPYTAALSMKINQTTSLYCILAQLTDIIGPEMQECILWRKGALLYMYSSTVQEDIERVQKQALEFKQVTTPGGPWY